MAERNCKKCFHYVACKEVASHSGYADINYTESQCKHFIPTADVQEVKHGEWLHKNGEMYCSICGSEALMDEVYYQSPHCPNCGAKMDGGQKSE